MSTALYRRYRPDTFDDVIGQDHVTGPLRAALRANRVSHAYLFSGPRGCGKTTSARILARCLNCDQGPTDTPCGECDSCKELATGGPGSLDVVEMDAASHGGVDDARELRERAAFAPVRDRFKIFIIDEAHMVTSQGFNALLKLVEEPPEHVKFIFATTEPDKVLNTIRSRTHHYPFRLVPPDVLQPYLQHLSDLEHVHVEDGVLALVMRAGGGSVRDTLSVLDQLIAGVTTGTLDYAQTVALLGYTDTALLDQTVDALAGGDGAAAYRVIERMVDSGHEPRRFVEDFLQRLRDLLIIAVAGDGATDVLSGIPVDQLGRMQNQARAWGAPGLSRAADLADQALREMVGATSPRLQLELLIGRILVPSQVADISIPTGAQAQMSPIPGAVGRVGGGAPQASSTHATTAPGGGGPAAPSTSEEAGRFGAEQARAQLKRAREAAQAPAASVPTQSAPRQNADVPPQPVPPSPQHRPTPATAAQAAPTSAVMAAPAHTAPTSATLPADKAVPAADLVPEVEVAPAVDPAPATPTPAVEPTPAHTAPTASTPTASTPTAPADSTDQPTPQAPPRTQARQQPSNADMIRDRWPEIVERLANVSRVTWTMLNGDGQLGAVTGSEVIVIFPHPGQVANFEQHGRSRDVQQVILDATGLTMQVHAQVAQSGGGAPVSTPGAVAATPTSGPVQTPMQNPARTPGRNGQTPTAHHQQPGRDTYGSQPQRGTDASRRTMGARHHQAMPGGSDQPADPDQEPAPSSGWTEVVATIPQSDPGPTPHVSSQTVPGPNGRTFRVVSNNAALPPSPDNGDAPGLSVDPAGELAQQSQYQRSDWGMPDVPPEQDDAEFQPDGDQYSGASQRHSPAMSIAAHPAGKGHAPTAPHSDNALAGNVTGRSAGDAGDTDGDTGGPGTRAPGTPADRVAMPGDSVTPAGGDERHGSHEGLVDGPTGPAPARVGAAEDESASPDDVETDMSQQVGLPAVLAILGGTVIDKKTDE